MPQIMVNGLKYHYLDLGQGIEPPLVLLHGFSGSSEDWKRLIAGLINNRRIIAIDLPGHGQTESMDQPQRNTMQSVAMDITSLMDLLEISQVNLLGYSMGGRLALYMAITSSINIKALILESTSPGLASSLAREERRSRDEALAQSIEVEGVRAFVDKWQLLPLFASQNNLSKEILARQREQRLKNSAIGLANSLRGMGTGNQPSLWPALKSLQIPTLLLVGALDFKFVQINEQMAQQISGSTLEIIPAVGHNIHLEVPSKFAETVTGFLNSCCQLSYTEQEHKQ